MQGEQRKGVYTCSTMSTPPSEAKRSIFPVGGRQLVRRRQSLEKHGVEAGDGGRGGGRPGEL